MDKEEYKMNNFVLCQNETFNKFSVITWWSFSLLEETEYYKETANVVPGRNCITNTWSLQQ